MSTFDSNGSPRPRRRNYRAEVKAGPPPGSDPRFKNILRKMLMGTALLVVLGGIVFTGIFIWYFCRIEPVGDQIAVLIRKTGKNLAPDEIIATEEGQKGIQPNPLAAGRYFYNPYTWDWAYDTVTIIPEDHLGVVTRLHGKDLPNGEIIAPAGYKGIAEEILPPGKHIINPYAEQVSIFPAVRIGKDQDDGHGKTDDPTSYVGVVVRLSGKDPLHGEIPEDQKNVFIVGKDVKGVQAEVLDPGIYYLNPYIYSVIQVNLRSQIFELKGEDAITFLTQDGFTVVVEGTIEFSLMRGRVPQLIHQVGDINDILNKIILPKARGFSRIEGSKHPAIGFIVGETRQEFQNSLEKHLVAQCSRWGVEIRSMLISNITPPEEVAAIIREREIALQNQRKIEEQIEQARSQAELTRQEMLAIQNRERVEVETVAIRARIQAEQEQSVELTSGYRELEVAKLEAEAAKLQADAIIIEAEANRDVVAMKNEAEASVTAAMTDAFGGGVNLARYTLYQKTAPQIQAIISTDRAPGLGGIFKPFMPEAAATPGNRDE